MRALDTANPAAGWGASTPMNQHRGDLCAASSNTSAFVFGGFSSSDWSQALDDLELLTAGGAWRPLGGTNSLHRGDSAVSKTSVCVTCMRSCTAHTFYGVTPQCAAVGSRLFVLGGENKNATDGRRVLSAVESYDAAADTWAQLAAVPSPRFRFSSAAASIGGSDFIFVTGGQLPLATTRVDIPWDTPAAAMAVGGEITVDATSELVFTWSTSTAHSLILLPDADALASCSTRGPGVTTLATANSSSFTLTPPARVSELYLSSAEPGDCAAGYKLRVIIRGRTAATTKAAALAATAASSGRENWAAAKWTTGGQMTVRSLLPRPVIVTTPFCVAG
jgi:hypothetical protein